MKTVQCSFYVPQVCQMWGVNFVLSLTFKTVAPPLLTTLYNVVSFTLHCILT